MSKDPPDRITVSIPADHDLDLDAVDALIESGPFNSRSEAVRAAIQQLDPNADD